MTKKCLTIEAMEKCQCEWCKTNRKIREIQIKQQAKIDAMRNFNALQEIGAKEK